tara:strand:- start:289 stop:2997 length:2709 start_codon:yes stop_codon:yes gene_type:complete
MSQYPLQAFLKKYATKEKNGITHTRIGDKELNIYGGKYSIPDEKINEFYKLYNRHAFTNKKLEFLTEVQRSTGPILIDLDFRFSTDVEDRIYEDQHIQDMLELYLKKLQNLVDLNNSNFNIYIFEKCGVNLLDDVTKDGIHIIFGINTDRVIQQMLREDVLTEISDILEDLPLTNSYEDVVDNGICRGTTNWQLYGSCKPGNDKYQLTKMYNIIIDNNNVNWNLQDITKESNLKILNMVSARNTTNKQYTINDNYKERYEIFKKRVIPKKIKLNKTTKINKDRIDINNITSVEQLQNKIERIIDELPHEEYLIKETYGFTMCLGENYYNPYANWIKVGWALHNTCWKPHMFLIWMLFSSKSSKFNIDDILDHYEKWQTMKVDSEDFKTYTNRSIMFWARNDNFEEYKKTKELTIEYFMEYTLQGATEFDIANVLFQLYKDQYKCDSIKRSGWYEFINHRWKEIDSGTSLRYKISNELCPKYLAKVSELMNKICLTEEQDEAHLKLQKQCKKYSDIAVMLKKTSHKKNIMRECCELFYEANFIDRLDKNPYLLCFNNGVVDFKEKVFRRGLPEDYLSICTNTDYIPYNPKNDLHISIRSEIEEFFHQLFPIEELCNYMWEHLASVLIGTNENQTFNIYNGCGRNGKSKLVELMEMCLGDYKGSVPITLVTGKRNSIGSCSPEIAMLQGRRYAVMQEPSKGDIINEGIMKEITGGDPIQGRPLYKDTVTYVPQFSLVVCTNNLFEIKSQEDGTWRRIRLCEFMSKFNENPEPNNKYEFIVDKKIKNKFIEWAPIFTSMLVNKAFEIDGIVKDCDIVMNKSNQYRQDQDFVSQFCIERVVEDEDGKIKPTALWSEFSQWYGSNFGTKDKPKAKDLYEYMNKNHGKREKGRPWSGVRLLYENDLED